MLTPEEISQQAQAGVNLRQQNVKTETFHKGLFLGLKVAFAQMVGTALKTVKKSTFSVNVENQVRLPETQKIEGEVSLKDFRILALGLNEVVKSLRVLSESEEKNTRLLSKELKPEKADFTSLERAVKDIKIPEVKIPEPRKEISVSNLSELRKPLADLASKLKIEFPAIHIPEFPENITVSNLEGIEKLLSGLTTQVEELSKKKLPETNIKPLVDATKAVKKAIDELVFPVPTFNIPKSSSGYVAIEDTSLTTEIDNAAKAVTNKVEAGQTIIDYVQATVDGITYRKTLTYDGSANLTAVSAWVAQ